MSTHHIPSQFTNAKCVNRPLRWARTLLFFVHHLWLGRVLIFSQYWPVQLQNSLSSHSLPQTTSRTDTGQFSGSRVWDPVWSARHLLEVHTSGGSGEKSGWNRRRSWSDAGLATPWPTWQGVLKLMMPVTVCKWPALYKHALLSHQVLVDLEKAWPQETASLSLRLTLKELRARGHLQTTLSAAGHHVLPFFLKGGSGWNISIATAVSNLLNFTL